MSVIGYCLGALLSIMYSALHRQDIRNLVTIAAPFDMSIREFPSYLLIDWLSEDAIDGIIAANGNCPAWLLESFFAAVASLYGVGELLGVCAESERDHYAKLYPAFRRWLDSEVPIAGRLFRELEIDIFKRNLLYRGEMQVRKTNGRYEANRCLTSQCSCVPGYARRSKVEPAADRFGRKRRQNHADVSDRSCWGPSSALKRTPNYGQKSLNGSVDTMPWPDFERRHQH